MTLELFHRHPPVRLAQHALDQILGLPTQMHIIREKQVIAPVDDLAVHIVRIFRTERREPYQNPQL
jgi:hypothetical protein